MANPARPAVCSTADYQLFHPLAGFPPALGWCSTVSLLPRRSEHDDANALAPRDIQCPTGSTLCALLADLKATDREFARGACCCIGVCVGDEPTAIVTIPEITTPTFIPSTLQASSSVTYNLRHSSHSYMLPLSTSSSLSESFTTIQRHSSDSLEPMPSSLTNPHSLTSSESSSSTSSSLILTTSSSSNPSTSTSILSSSTSSSLLPTSSSTSTSSSSSSFSSSSSSTSSSASVPSSTCPAVAAGGATYMLYYSGTGYVENTNNPGNNNPANYPPEYSTIAGTVAMCDAAATCASTTYNYPANYYSFDLHLVMSNSTWECVSYLNQNSGTTAASYFNVADADAEAAYGYTL